MTEPLIKDLAELLQAQGSSLWASPTHCRNLLMDLLGKSYPIQTPCLAALAFLGYPLKLWEAVTAGLALNFKLLEPQHQLLEKRFNATQIDESISIWREAVTKLQKTAITTEEKDLVNMVIVPKVKTGDLNPQAEQEIYEAAAVKNIAKKRTDQLVENYLKEYKVSRATTPLKAEPLSDKSESVTVNKSSEQQSVFITLGVVVLIGLIFVIYQVSKPSNQTTIAPPAPSSAPTQLPSTKLAVSQATASSEIPNSSFGSYPASHVIDGDPHTCWQESVNPGEGIGQWVKLNLSSPKTVTSLVIVNGFAWPDHPTYGDVFKGNPRVKTATLSYSSGESETISINDTLQPQQINLSKPIKTSSVKLIIDSVYSGNQWPDASISEIALYGHD